MTAPSTVGQRAPILEAARPNTRAHCQRALWPSARSAIAYVLSPGEQANARWLTSRDNRQSPARRKKITSGGIVDCVNVHAMCWSTDDYEP